MANLDPTRIVFEEPEERDFVVFPKGVYKFRILEINEIKLSRENSSPMLPVKLECERANGETTTVFDNILLTDAAKWKLNAFLKCLGKDAMKSGKELSLEDPHVISWMKRQTGNVRLKVERPPGKDYDRNTVENYIYSKSAEEVKPAPKPVIPEDADDDIPF